MRKSAPNRARGLRRLGALAVVPFLGLLCTSHDVAGDPLRPATPAEIQPAALDGSAAPTLPNPPFAVPAPFIELVADEPRGLDRHQLFVEAREAWRKLDSERAIRLAATSVSRGGRGHLLLARIYARLGRRDPAFYWLQRAAREEGVDPRAAAKDRELRLLREDRRWPVVASFLERAAAYWAANGARSLIVVGPEPATARARYVLVALHADGDEPEDILDGCGLRARRRGTLCLGVSGTVPLGPLAYRWSVDPEENRRHVRAALGDARLGTATRQPVVLVGVGEGAQVALETAARDPLLYRGAIAMSPHGLGWHLEQLAHNPVYSRQGYVVAFGSLEGFATVGTSYVDADLLRQLGARVVTHPAWFYARRPLPPDLDVRLPQWIDFVVDGRQRAAR